MLVGLTKCHTNITHLRIRPNAALYQSIEIEVGRTGISDVDGLIRSIGNCSATDMTLETLFDLDLHELVWEWPYCAQMGEEFIQKVSGAWPNLEKLYFIPVPFFVLPERPWIRLRDLRHLAPMQHLKSLALYVDGVQPIDEVNSIEDVYDQPDEKRSGSLRDFDPGRSWINDPTFVSKALSDYFPNAQLPQRMEQRATLWGEVAGRLRKGLS